MHKYELRKYLLVTVTLLSILVILSPASVRAKDPQSGDLIFLKLNEQTQDPTHVGILMMETDEFQNKQFMVYEVWGARIQKTPLSEVLERVGFDINRWFFRHPKNLNLIHWKKKKQLRTFLEEKRKTYEDINIQIPYLTSSELVADAFNAIFPGKPFVCDPLTQSKAEKPRIDALDIELQGNYKEIRPDEKDHTWEQVTPYAPIFLVLCRNLIF